MTLTALEELIEIQANLAELRALALDLPPNIRRILQLFADRVEARARAIDKMI